MFPRPIAVAKVHNHLVGEAGEIRLENCIAATFRSKRPNPSQQFIRECRPTFHNDREVALHRQAGRPWRFAARTSEEHEARWFATAPAKERLRVRVSREGGRDLIAKIGERLRSIISG